VILAPAVASCLVRRAAALGTLWQLVTDAVNAQL
jgi:hypothetical protein